MKVLLIFEADKCCLLSGTGHQYTYYFSINVTNAASKDAELRWQGVSGEDQLVVWKSSNAAKETVVTSSTMPSPFAIVAYEKGTGNMMMVNNIESINVPLSMDKQTTYLTVTDGEFLKF